MMERTGYREVRPAAPGGIGGGTTVTRFRVKNSSDFGEYLLCRTWDGTTEGDTDVPVARPQTLRRSYSHGKSIAGVTYTWQGMTRRLADDGQIQVQEAIAPPYVVDDEIYAARQPRGGTGVVVSADVPVVWLDVNADGRQFLPETDVASTSVHQRMVVKDARPDDWLICRTLDELDQEGTIDLLVARPFLLRRTPFDQTSRDGVFLDYINANTRDGKILGFQERQIIQPAYRVGDHILAVRDVSGGAGIATPGGYYFRWLDTNNDCRAWARDNG